MKVVLAVGVNYCIRCLLVSVDCVHARENGLEYNLSTGKFRHPDEAEYGSAANGAHGSSARESSLNGTPRQLPNSDDEYLNNVSIPLQHHSPLADALTLPHSSSAS